MVSSLTLICTNLSEECADNTLKRTFAGFRIFCPDQLVGLDFLDGYKSLFCRDQRA